MARSGGRRIGAALLAGGVILLAGPAWLVWNALRARDWDERTLKVRFHSVRYEGAGFVFGYLVQNRTFRTARFGAEETQVRALQAPDSLSVGYAHLPQPMVIPARSEELVHIRIELPSAPRALLREFSNEQTRRVLQARPPGTPHDDSAVSPLPMRKIPRETAAEALEELPVQPWSPDQWLANLDGFEIVN